MSTQRLPCTRYSVMRVELNLKNLTTVVCSYLSAVLVGNLLLGEGGAYGGDASGSSNEADPYRVRNSGDVVRSTGFLIQGSFELGIWRIVRDQYSIWNHSFAVNFTFRVKLTASEFILCLKFCFVLSFFISFTISHFWGLSCMRGGVEEGRIPQSFCPELACLPVP